MKTVIDTAVLVIDVPLPDLLIELGKGSMTGIGDRWVRRNRPTSPSTPPFSWRSRSRDGSRKRQTRSGTGTRAMWPSRNASCAWVE